MTPLHRLPVVATATALLAVPAAAHGATARAVGVAFPAVVAGTVVASLLGGGLVFAVHCRGSNRGAHGTAVPLLLLALGGAALVLAVARSVPTAGVAFVGAAAVYRHRDASLTDCGSCADATLGAVTVHRSLEGVVLATVYAADAALGLVGAAILAVHAAAETAAVGALYAAVDWRHAVGAVCLVQVGFVLGVAAGWSAVDAVPPVVQAGLLALVGGVLLGVGGRETYRRHVVPQATPA